MVRVLLNDPGGIFVGVERVHEDERNVDFVMRVKVLSTRTKQISKDWLFSSQKMQKDTHLDLTNRKI